jgi:hypothetical protein|tara:strand:+ start:809 stop:1096 length:288 start_codon:yes stop_codon:yes gene_type:complete
MFIWEKSYVKVFKDGKRKYYFLRNSGTKVHALYSHPDDYSVMVYHETDCGEGNESAASELFISKGVKRLSRDYVLYRADTMIGDALDFDFSFYSA